MFEGVKLADDKGWALILPDSDEPVCRVYSEGFNEEYAEELAAFLREKNKANSDKGKDEN
jgi:mannose-1-phosphate guanylyltransferase/phosphomannomutase